MTPQATPLYTPRTTHHIFQFFRYWLPPNPNSQLHQGHGAKYQWLGPINMLKSMQPSKRLLSSSPCLFTHKKTSREQKQPYLPFNVFHLGLQNLLLIFFISPVKHNDMSNERILQTAILSKLRGLRKLEQDPKERKSLTAYLAWMLWIAL